MRIQLLKLMAVFAVSASLIWTGCSTAPQVRSSAGGLEAPGDDGVDIVVNGSPVDHFRARYDSLISLYEFGDVADFQVQRESLLADIETYMREHPAPNDSALTALSIEVSSLDSVSIANEYRHEFLNEIDSLALSTMEWPEVSMETVDTITNTIHDTLFPYIEDRRIDFWIRYFTGPGRERFSRTLYRMVRYRPIIEGILEEMGLPKTLLCVPLIESGFYMKATSRAKAVGPWQFISGTARIYGLRVNWWIDERRDIVASTYAAANYLKDLYQIWNSWPLALAAYNAGEFRIARAVVHHKSEDFWKLRLPKQTERYVPKFFAALYIVRDPKRYGFHLPKVEPLEFDVVTVHDATDLDLIARLCETELHVIRELNPALMRYCSPPKTEIEIKVPKGKGELCSSRLASIPAEKRVTWRRHRIRSGETLWRIARRYGTTIETLRKLNGIRNPRLIRKGRTLLVPVRGAYAELASSRPSYRKGRRKLDRKTLESYARKAAGPSGYKKVIYVVKDHDTLGEIAELFGTSAKKLRLWNNLRYRSYIYPGQKLTIYVPPSFRIPSERVKPAPKPRPDRFTKKVYTVRRGDTLYGISRKFNVRVSDLLAWNRKSPRSKIYPGERIEIWMEKD